MQNEVRGGVVLSAAACSILLTTSAARAEGLGDIALTQLEPSVAGDAFFGVASPFIGGHLKPRAGVLLDHGSDPLKLSIGSTSSALVGSQTWLHVGASLALWDRLLVGVDLPIVVVQGVIARSCRAPRSRRRTGRRSGIFASRFGRRLRRELGCRRERGRSGWRRRRSGELE